MARDNGDRAGKDILVLIKILYIYIINKDENNIRISFYYTFRVL